MRITKPFAYAMFTVALVNFVSFVCIAQWIGGDALNGYTAGGHYFLSNHGKLTEVSGTVFEYSRWHALSMFVTHPAALLVGWQWRRSAKAVHQNV
jgi:hypothetical protein